MFSDRLALLRSSHPPISGTVQPAKSVITRLKMGMCWMPYFVQTATRNNRVSLRKCSLLL